MPVLIYIVAYADGYNDEYSQFHSMKCQHYYLIHITTTMKMNIENDIEWNANADNYIPYRRITTKITMKMPTDKAMPMNITMMMYIHIYSYVLIVSSF